MEKIYLLTAGKYSEYHVVAIFSTLEQAETMKRWYNEGRDEYDQARIDERPLNPTIPIAYRDLWWVEIKLADGEITNARMLPRYYTASDVIEGGVEKAWDYKTFLGVQCFAKDQEHAIKIAGERRKEHLAKSAV